MPNTITLNSGTGGELLSTDQIVEAGVTAHAQYIKILSGSAASSAAIGGTIADGLYVNVRNVSGAVQVSAAGTQLVSGTVTVQGSVLVSAVGHVLVSGDGNFAVVGDVGVSADPSSTFFVATSVDRAVDVSADPSATFFVATSVDRNISVSAQGGVNWPVSALVRGLVTAVASPQATFFVASSVDTVISISAANNVNIPVSIGNGVAVSADPSATFFVATSVDRNVSVSAQGNTNMPVTAVGHINVSAVPAATFFVTTSADRRVYVAPAMGLGSASPASANGTPNPIKYVYINASAAGDLTLVASTASRAIRVIGYAFICPNSALPVFFQDTEATTAPKIHAAFTTVTGGGVSYSGGIHAPAFQTTVGAGLELKRGVTSDAVVQGHLTFIEVS